MKNAEHLVNASLAAKVSLTIDTQPSKSDTCSGVPMNALTPAKTTERKCASDLTPMSLHQKDQRQAMTSSSLQSRTSHQNGKKALFQLIFDENCIQTVCPKHMAMTCTG